MYNNVYIYPHLHLGDNIVCNGLIRNLIKDYDQINLFIKQSKAPSVMWMYRDLKNIKYLMVQKEPQAEEWIKLNNPQKLLKIGYEFRDNNINFDQAFYKQYNIDFEKRWTDFYLDRDMEREKSFFKRFNVKEGEYIFFHEDNGNNYKGKFIINRKLVPQNVPTIYAKENYTNNIFDYCYIIEHAKEIHVVESSFLFLADTLNITDKLYSHRYARRYPPDEKPTLKNKWTIYDL